MNLWLEPNLTHCKKLKKKKNHNPSTPKNRPNPTGWVGSSWFWWVGNTPLTSYFTKEIKQKKFQLIISLGHFY